MAHSLASRDTSFPALPRLKAGVGRGDRRWVTLAPLGRSWGKPRSPQGGAAGVFWAFSDQVRGHALRDTARCARLLIRMRQSFRLRPDSRRIRNHKSHSNAQLGTANPVGIGPKTAESLASWPMKFLLLAAAHFGQTQTVSFITVSQLGCRVRVASGGLRITAFEHHAERGEVAHAVLPRPADAVRA
jgi:hypothetical protein